MNHKITDITGQRFGRLVAWWPAGQGRPIGQRPNHSVMWLCCCDCGTLRIASAARLRHGDPRSCGCLHREQVAEMARRRNTTHGKKHTPEYSVWNSMISRCTLANHQAYKNYGGRGITVCQRWRESFEAFLEDMGPRPDPNLTLDRTNNDGNYEPGNCRWATRSEQVKNTRKRKRDSRGRFGSGLETS